MDAYQIAIQQAQEEAARKKAAEDAARAEADRRAAADAQARMAELARQAQQEETNRAIAKQNADKAAADKAAADQAAARTAMSNLTQQTQINETNQAVVKQNAVRAADLVKIVTPSGNLAAAEALVNNGARQVQINETSKAVNAPRVVDFVPPSYSKVVAQAQTQADKTKKDKEGHDTTVQSFLTDPYSVGGGLSFDEKITLAKDYKIDYNPQFDLQRNYIAIGDPINPDYLSKKQYNDIIKYLKDNNLNVEDIEHDLKTKGLTWFNTLMNQYSESQADIHTQQTKKWEADVLPGLPDYLQTAYNNAKKTGDFTEYAKLADKYTAAETETLNKELLADPEVMKIYQANGPEAALKAYKNKQVALFESNLRGNDPEGWKIYVDAGKGDKGNAAYRAYMEKNYVYSPVTHEWLPRRMMEELEKTDKTTYAVFMKEGYVAGKKYLKDAGTRMEKERQAAVDKAIDDAVTEAEKPVKVKENYSASANTWKTFDDYKAAETAYINALDKVDHDNPNMPAADREKLYQDLPEYKAYHTAVKANQENRTLMDDVLAEVFSSHIITAPKKGGQIPTMTFNRDQLGQMYADNVKITLAIYTGDTGKLKKLYDSGAFGDDKDTSYAAYNDAMKTVGQQQAIKKAVEAGDLKALAYCYHDGYFGDDQEGYEKLRDYVKAGGRELAPITAQDIKSVVDSMGTKEENIKKTAESYPSGGSIATDVGLSLIPVVGTVHNWDKMGAGGKAFAIVTDVLTFAPFVGAAVRAGRGIETAVGMGSRLKIIGKAMGQEALAQVRAPVDIIIHPVETAKTVGRGIRNTAEYLGSADKLGEMVISTSDGVTRIRIGADMPTADAFRSVNEIMSQSTVSGGKIIVQRGNTLVEVNRSALMEALGGGLAHTSPDLEKLFKNGTVISKNGFPADEQGLFVAMEPVTDFASDSAFGGGKIPIAKEATGTVYDIAKYRVESLVKIDKAPVRTLDFANAKNVPDDLAAAIQKYTRENDGIVYGSMNEYTKIKKASLPNDLDLAFGNQAKAMDDIEALARNMGYKTRRAPHAIEIMDGGEWKQIADIADIKAHKSQIPEGLSHSALTRIDGIRTETMGEQFLRQSYGAVSGTEKAAQRAERVNKAAKEVKKMLEAAGAEKRRPGVVIFSPEHSLEAVPTNKTYHSSVENERKFTVGHEAVKDPDNFQHLWARTGPRGERIEIFLEKRNGVNPLSEAQVGKLQSKGIIEYLKAPFRQQIKITNIGKTAKNTVDFEKDMGVLENAIREAGNTREADALRRVVKNIRSTQRIPAIIARGAVAGMTAAAAAGAAPAGADDINDIVNTAYEDGNKGDYDSAYERLANAETARVDHTRGRKSVTLVTQRIIEAMDVKSAARILGARPNARDLVPIDNRVIKEVIERTQELRDARKRGLDVRVEASWIALRARELLESSNSPRTEAIRDSTGTRPSGNIARLPSPIRPGSGMTPTRGRIPVYSNRGDTGFIPRAGYTPDRTPPTDRPPRTPPPGRTPPDVPPPNPPEKGRGSLHKKTDKEKRDLIRTQKGATTYNMGKLQGKDVWWTHMDDGETIVVLGKPPEGATLLADGPGSTSKTAQRVGNSKDFKPYFQQHGAVRASINPARSQKGVQIQFKSEKHGKQYYTDMGGATGVSSHPIGRRKKR